MSTLSAVPGVITVFGSSQIQPGSNDWTAAHDTGLLLGRAGFTVATGGYGGAMEAVSAGAAATGVAVIGVTAPAVFPDRPGANPFVTDERPVPTLLERVHLLTDIATGFIVLPGSIGTLTELVAAWNLAFVARLGGGRSKPLVTVGPRWAEIVVSLAGALDTDGSLVEPVLTPAEAVETLQRRLG